MEVETPALPPPRVVQQNPNHLQFITPSPFPQASLTKPPPSSSSSSSLSLSRRIVLDFSHPWLVTLQQVCSSSNSPTTCSAMYAGDWMYLCACHGEEKQCCAIDYMIHTLDGTSALLNSARHFPSRTFIPNTSLRHFGSVARRLSRILFMLGDIIGSVLRAVR